MPYYGYGYYGYGDFLANNIYCLLLIPVLLLSVWAQIQVSGNFRRYAVTNRRRLTGAQAAEAVLRSHGVYDVPVRMTRGNLTDHYDPRDNTIYLSESVYGACLLYTSKRLIGSWPGSTIRTTTMTTPWRIWRRRR